MDHDVNAAHRGAAAGGAAAVGSATDVPPINPPSIHNFYGPVNYVIVGNATGTFSSVACPMCGVGKASKAGSTAR